VRSPLTAIPFAVVGAILVLAACSDSESSSPPVEPVEEGTGGTGGEDAAGGGAGEAAGGTAGQSMGGSTQTCPTCTSREECWSNQLCVAKQVSVPAGFSIDATEVTRTQYAAWLATNPPTTGQSSTCAWNTTFEPPSCAWPPASKGNHPVVCVDWCDAFAYCKAIGKRLCGSIKGGPTPWTSDDVASISQWYNACSAGGTTNFPYGGATTGGDGYDALACNGAESGHSGTVPVASLSDCQSSAAGYKGVFDMSGNAWEWEDSCDGTEGETDSCRRRGGGFQAYMGMLHCKAPYGEDYNDHRSDVKERRASVSVAVRSSGPDLPIPDSAPP